MKRVRILLMAFAAMTMGLMFAACDKDDNNTGNGGSNNGGGQGGGTSDAGWVDLGLPSGLLWATCNLGADTPEEYGDYYAWGDTSTQDTYSWSTYKYCMGDYDQLTKYCNNASYGYNGFTDELTTLQAIDDAAAAKLGNGARMPTRADWQELLENTTPEWTNENGVFGRKFSASNGKSIFLPAAGSRDGSDLYDDALYGYYWASSLYTSDPYYAWSLGFWTDGQLMNYGRRNNGFSVRAVRDSRN